MDHPPHSRGIGYRADIDGLRAMAVLSIFIFHINDALLPGGFIGVDIFFVISGFLITSIIDREIAEQRFTLAGFYKRRILRIAPAYFVTTVATLVAGCLLMLPEDLEALARSALWSALSLPNVYFWLYLDTSYFAPASDQIPLLHLWSLGVEEQFYLLWPLTLLLLSRWLRRRYVLIGTLAMAATASFVLAQSMAGTSPTFAYYMLPTRAGELLIGALLGLVLSHDDKDEVRSASHRVRIEVAALLGYALLGYGLFALDGESLFPGINALYPCLGTALLIYAGGRGKSASLAPLRWQPVVWIGLISYSLYLWHWPVLAFLRYFTNGITPFAGVLCFVLVLLLAFLSYRYVEIPFQRARRHIEAKTYSVPLGYACMIFFVAIGAGILLKTDGLEKLITTGDAQFATKREALKNRTRPAFEYSYNCQRTSLEIGLFSDDRCVVGPRGSRRDTPTRALLVGDSNAGHYVGVLGAIAAAEGFSFRNVSMSRCPPILGAKDQYGRESDRARCTEYRDAVRKFAKDYDYIFLASQWTSHSKNPHFKRDMERTVTELTRGRKTVIVLGQVPRFPFYNQTCELRRLRMPIIDCRSQAEQGGLVVKKMNRFLSSLAKDNPRVKYMDVTRVVCTRGICSPYLAGQPIYHDPGHLSMTGSWEVGQRMVERGVPLKAMFMKISTDESRMESAASP